MSDVVVETLSPSIALVSDDSAEMPDDLLAALLRIDVRTTAIALVDSFGQDGSVTPETVRLVRDTMTRHLLFGDDEATARAESATYIGALIGALAQVLAQAQRELKARANVILEWPE